MPNTIDDQIGFVPDSQTANALGFVPDAQPAVKLDPLAAAQMQTGMVDPENAGLSPSDLISGRGPGEFTAATRGGLPGILASAINAVQQHVVEPVGAKVLNTLADLGESDTGISPDENPDDQFQPGKSVIPDEALPLAKEKGFVPALTRAVQGFTTPGNILALPLAPTSELAKSGFFAGATSGMGDSIQKLADAQSPEEKADAATELALNAGFAALLHGGAEPGSTRGPVESEAPITTPQQADQFLATVKQPEESATKEPEAPTNPPLTPAAQPPGADLGFIPDNQPAPPEDAAKPAVAKPQPVLTADGQVDPVQTAIAKLKAQQAISTTEAQSPQSGTVLTADATKTPETAPSAAAAQQNASGAQQPVEVAQTAPNPALADIREQQALETVQEAFGLNKAQSDRLAELQNRNDNKRSNAPLTPAAEVPISGVAAPGTSTVRPADELSNDRQRGRVQGNPGMTAEEGSNPSLGAAGSLPRKQVSRADSQRPPDLIDHIQGEVGTIDPTLIKEANPHWKPVGAARKIFKKGGTPADAAINALPEGFGVTKDTPIDQFGDAINAAATARKGWRKQFYKQEQQLGQEARQQSTFNKDIGQQSKGTQVLVPDDLNEGDEFSLKGAKFKVSRLDYDEDGRVTHLTLDDGKKYGTQEVDGGTALRMDTGSHVAKGEAPSFSEKAEQLAQKLEDLKTGIGKGGQLHAFGVAADLWDRAVSVAQKLIRAGGNVADAIDEAIHYIKTNFKGQFDEGSARASLSRKLINPEDEAPERERTTGEVKSDLATASDELKTAIANRPGKGKVGEQASAMAGAKYRLLRAELLHHPDYARENLKTLNDSITEANAILKPHDMAVRPDDYPNPDKLQKALTPEEFARVQELQEKISTAHQELLRQPKKLVSRVHGEMQDRGELPKSNQLDTNSAGRTLAAMTDFLKANKFDSPKQSFGERLAIGKRFADAGKGIKDAVTRAWTNSVAAWKSFLETYKQPPKDTDYRSAKKSWIAYDQRTAVENYRYVRALMTAVPNAVRRKAMSVWLDAGGDKTLLASQHAEVPDNYKAIWKAAQELTPDEIRIANQVKADLEAKLEDARNVGLIDKGREDYGVPQRWKTPPQAGERDPFDETGKKTAGNPYAKLDTRDPFFSLQRQVPSYFDGIMAKGEPENLDIAHLVSVYDTAFHKALGSRGWIGALQDARADDGSPVVQISGKAATLKKGDESTTLVDARAKPASAVTADGRLYKSYDHPALKDWKFVSKDAAGNPVLVKGDMLIHPDHFNDIKNELETPQWTQKGVGSAALKGSAFLKSSKFIGPFHVVTEALHAAFHGVLPNVHGFDIDLNDPDQALLNRNMVLGFGSAREMFEDGLGSHGGIWKAIPGIGDAVQAMNHFTFNEYIPRLKMKVGLRVLERNKARYSKELTPEQIGELTGRQMDAAFGGQNWRLMGTNKSLLAGLRLGLVAPDFLISRSKVIAQALKPYNKEQRVFLLAQAAGVYVLSRVLNTMFSDNHDPHWGLKDWDSVVIGKRAYHARFLVSDAANLARDLLGMGSFDSNGIPFITGRLGVIPKIAAETLSGRDLFTGQKKENLFGGNSPLLKAFSTVVEDTGQWMTPMFVDGFLGGARRGQTGPGSLLTALVGISSRKETAAGDVYDMAAKYNRNSSDPKAQAYEKEREGTTEPDSVYKPLDNLLDAGDLKGAKAEYQSMIAQGKKPDDIAKRYQVYTANGTLARPFTGNQAREQQFVNSLSDANRATYREAINERKAMQQKFRQMLGQ